MNPANEISNSSFTAHKHCDDRGGIAEGKGGGWVGECFGNTSPTRPWIKLLFFCVPRVRYLTLKGYNFESVTSFSRLFD